MLISIIFNFIVNLREPHLEIITRTKIEDERTPLTITECLSPSSTENFLLVCNDNAKLRLINADTKMCRKVFALPQTMQSFKVKLSSLGKHMHSSNFVALIQ